jgi:hypothetical protein
MQFLLRQDFLKTFNTPYRSSASTEFTKPQSGSRPAAGLMPATDNTAVKPIGSGAGMSGAEQAREPPLANGSWMK